MKKLKFLFAALAFTMCGAGTAWADTSLLTEANGWLKLTALPENVADYYFTIVDNNNDLMLSLARGKNQNGSYNGLYYKTSANPLIDKSMLFTMELYSGVYVMTNAEYNSLFLQTEYNAAQFYRTHDNGGGNKDWGKISFTYADNCWTVQNAQYPVENGNYLGVWNDNQAAANGQELALNKPASMKGTYQIYAILKTKAVEYYDALRAGTGASETNPLDMTALIVNPNANFWTGSIPFGWTTTGTQNVNTGNGYDLFPGIFEYSNWNAGSWTGSLKQTITVPNGKYIVKAAFMASSGVTVYLTSNGSTAQSETLAPIGDSGGNIASDGTVVGDGEGNRGWKYLTLETKVTTGSLEIGTYAEANASHCWVNADNFTLTYLGADLEILIEGYENALADALAFDQSTIKEIAVKQALIDAINTYGENVAQTESALKEAADALTLATTNAAASVEAYTTAEKYFTKMEGVLDGTNVYTNEAYNAYYKDWKDAYDAGTLTTAVAATLTEDAAYTNRIRVANNIDDILLSTWTAGGTQCKDYTAALYINTWSTEGNSDGSEFYAPFFEYWVSSANVLTANTFTSTITGLKANTTYSFTIRARVQPTDNKTIIDNAITMKVGDGEPKCISAGNAFGNYFIGNFSAVGETDSDGKLTCTISVAENSNVSWLAFYNCKYTEGEDLSAYIADYEFALKTAKEAQANAAYDIVTGKEKADLDAAIDNYDEGKVDITVKQDLLDATEALNNATAAFEAAAPAYAMYPELNANVATTLGVALPTISATTTAADIEGVIISEYNAAKAYEKDLTNKLGAWNNAPGTNQGESWDGTGTDTYYDEYNRSARAMTQTVTLPVGNYVLIAKGRASVNGLLTVSDGTETVIFPHKNSTGRGIETNGTPNYSEGGNYANGGNGRGWEYRMLTFTSDGETPITLTFNWTTASSNWAGLDDIELLANLDLSGYVQEYQQALSEAKATLANDAYAIVTGKEKADLETVINSYDEGKVEETDPDALEAAIEALNNATEAFVAAAPAYNAFAELNTTVAAKLGVELPTITNATTAADLDVEGIYVDEYNAAEAYATDFTNKLGTWSNAPGTNKGESWKDSSDDYLDLYNASDRAMTQTVTLYAGDYALIAKGRSSATARLTVTDGTETVIFPHKGNTGRGIETDGKPNYTEGGTYTNSGNGRGWEYRVITFTSDGETPITLTFNWTTTGGQWAGLDDIELRANLNDEAMNKALAAAIAKVTALEGTIPAAAYAAAQAVVAKYQGDSYPTTFEEYETAIAEIEAAATTYGALAEPYTKTKELLEEANALTADYPNLKTLLNSYAAAVEAITNIDDLTLLNNNLTKANAIFTEWLSIKEKAVALAAVNNDNAGANTTLSGAITAQETNVQAVNNVDAENLAIVTTAIATVKAAMTTYVSVANPVGDGAQFDCTFMLTNPDVTPFWTGDWWVQPEGWYNEQSGGNFQVMVNENLGPGGEVFMEYWSESPAQKGFVLCQKVTLPEGTYKMAGRVAANFDGQGGTVQNVFFAANDAIGTQITSETLIDADCEFVQGEEDPVEVKIGMIATEGNEARWMAINKIQLFKVPAKAFTLDENTAWDNTKSGAGDVILKRTIKEGYNTLTLPFSMTQTEVEDNFGAGSVVYALKAYDADLQLISFTTHEGIVPNVPCLLKATEPGNTYLLEGRTIVAGNSAPEANGTDVTMIGTYAASMTVPTGNYIIHEDQIYYVNSNVSLKNTRAYIKLKPKNPLDEYDDVRSLTLSFDDDETTGIATMEDGQLNIVTGDIYDLSGRKVKNPAKGIYMMNGKKIIK
ncbi:MAG: hypothetical protein J5552_11585 [Prevotella sp.]|nr:hypothetical protein [Prevotella sp.]